MKTNARRTRKASATNCRKAIKPKRTRKAPAHRLNILTMAKMGMRMSVEYMIERGYIKHPEVSRLVKDLIPKLRLDDEWCSGAEISRVLMEAFLAGDKRFGLEYRDGEAYWYAK